MEDAANTSGSAVHGLGVIVGGEASLSQAIGEALTAAGVNLTQCFDEATEGLDTLVFVATNEPRWSFAATPVDDFSGRLGGALKSAFRAVQRGAAAIRAKGGGGSIVVVAPASADHRAFDAHQQGLRLLVKAAALELGPEGIRVNIVLPGAGETPLGRPCGPADVAASVAFAASSRAHFMTGADLVVDGGRLAR